MILGNEEIKLVTEKEKKNRFEMYLIGVPQKIKVIKIYCIIIGNQKSLRYNDDDNMGSLSHVYWIGRYFETLKIGTIILL